MKIFEISIFGFTLAPTYYWLMYALTFLWGMYYIKKLWKYTDSQRESLFFYIFFWVILWGRLWYIVFYNLGAYIADPLSIFKIWEWGMSFHGWALGMSIAVFLFARKYKLKLWNIADDLALIVPLWLFLWRIGNYINKELLWFPYEWALAVRTSQGSFFPSPLLEAFLEWVVIYLILRHIYSRKKFHGQLLSIFLILYGVFRILIELFIRTPDIHIWYYFGFLTQGSLLSLPMIVIWAVLYYHLSKTHAAK